MFLTNYRAGRHDDSLLSLTKSSDRRIFFRPEITPSFFFPPPSIREAAVSRSAATAVSAVTGGPSQPPGRCRKGQNCWGMNNVPLLRELCGFFLGFFFFPFVPDTNGPHSASLSNCCARPSAMRAWCQPHKRCVRRPKSWAAPRGWQTTSTKKI